LFNATSFTSLHSSTLHSFQPLFIPFTTRRTGMNEIHGTRRHQQTGKVENEVMEGNRSRLDELLKEVPPCYVKEVLTRLGELYCRSCRADADADFVSFRQLLVSSQASMLSLPPPTLTTSNDHISTKQYQNPTFTASVNSSLLSLHDCWFQLIRSSTLSHHLSFPSFDQKISSPLLRKIRHKRYRSISLYSVLSPCPPIPHSYCSIPTSTLAHPSNFATRNNSAS